RAGTTPYVAVTASTRKATVPARPSEAQRLASSVALRDLGRGGIRDFAQEASAAVNTTRGDGRDGMSRAAGVHALLHARRLRGPRARARRSRRSARGGRGACRPPPALSIAC